MATTDLFSTPSVISQQIEGGATPIVAKLFVNDKERNFIFFGSIDSVQTDRIQVDVALDGTMHVVICKGSLGACSVQLLDTAPSCINGDPDFAIKCYSKELNDLKSRTAKLELHDIRVDSTTGKQVASEAMATFRGIISGVRVMAKYTEGGIPVIITTLALMGTWRPK